MSAESAVAEFEAVVRSRLDQLVSELARENARAGRLLSERFNQTARRLRLAETDGEWRSILKETASHFCGKAEVFLAGDRRIAEGPAFANAMESKDTVVTLRDASQLSAGVVEALGAPLSQRCYLFPIVDGEEVDAVLYAEPGSYPLDRNALELLASVAGGSLPKAKPELVAAVATAGAPQLIQIAGVVSRKKQEAASPVELRGRRYARVFAARLILEHGDELRRGRRERKIYARLKQQIDLGRQEFHTLYLESWPSLADYLHQELVHTIARDDETALGSEYPGALR